MIMLNKMDNNMVAICGMNCTVCYKHLLTKKYAIEEFLKREKEKWTCSKCNGIISLHDRFCSECQQHID